METLKSNFYFAVFQSCLKHLECWDCCSLKRPQSGKSNWDKKLLPIRYWQQENSNKFKIFWWIHECRCNNFEFGSILQITHCMFHFNIFNLHIWEFTRLFYQNRTVNPMSKEKWEKYETVLHDFTIQKCCLFQCILINHNRLIPSKDI